MKNIEMLVEPTNSQKDIKNFKKSLRLEEEHFGTYVFAVAVSLDISKNELIEISTCYGTPLNFDIFNILKDVYGVFAVGYHDIGYIPLNYVLYIDDAAWKSSVPLPVSVIRKHMTNIQKKKLELWKSKHKNFDIKYYQIVGID